MFNRSFITILMLGAALSVQAEGFFDKLASKKPGNMNYKYLSLSYVDYDDVGDGIGFIGSFEIKKNIAAVFYYDSVSDNNVDGTVLGLDALVHQPFSGAKDTDLFYGVGFRRVEVEVGSFDASESGLVLTAGLRNEVDPDLEVNGRVAFETVDENDLEVAIGAVYEISEHLHFQGELLFADTDRLGLGVRYYIN